MKKFLVTITALILTAPIAAHADQFAKRNNEGNRLYEQGRLEEALSAYRAARIERPDAPEIDYNVGNVYHDQQIFDSALSQYQEALANLTGPLLPNTYYNLGNTLYRSGQYEPAYEAYKQALIENPNDVEAKHNLELALKALQNDSTEANQEDEQQQENQEQQQEQDSTSQQQNQDPNEEQNDSTQQQQQQQDQQDQNERQQQSQQESDQQQQEQDQQQQAQQPRGMTRADAERLLEALKQDELELQKKRAERQASSQPVEKDW